MSKFIAEGAYGAVFCPPIVPKECIAKKLKKYNNENYIGKVFTNYEEAAEEVMVYRDSIGKIDPKGKFTPRFRGFYIIYPIDFEDQSEYKKSKILNNNGINKDTELYQVVYDYAGIDLMNDDIMGDESDTLTFDKLLRLSINALKGLQTLEQNGLIHNDIKMENLMYDEEHSKINLIDFGVSQKTSNIYSQACAGTHSVDYCYYPMEYKVADAIRKARYGTTPRQFRRNAYEGYLRNIECLRNSFEEIGLDYDKEAIEYLEDEYNGIVPRTYESLQNHINKIDVYSYGLALMILYRDYVKKGYDVTGNNVYTKEQVETLLRKMTTPNPHKRLNISEAIHEIENMVSIVKKPMCFGNLFGKLVLKCRQTI